MDKTNIKRLSFLWAFLANHDKHRSNVAELIGLTQPMGSQWFIKDDILLSYIHKLLAVFGYTITFTLFKQGENAANTQTVETDSSNLAFLTDVRKQYKISQKDWADSINVTDACVRRWEKKDDILWSQVCLFAQNFGFDINVKISLAETDNEISNNKTKLTVFTDYVLPSSEPKESVQQRKDNLTKYWQKKKQEN